MIIMRILTPPIILIATAIFVCICMALPATSDSITGGSISGMVFFNTGNQNVPNGTIVSIVNGSNVSEYIPGYNMTPDSNGFFQFTNVSPGFYKVYAWSPYYTEGYSAGINVTSNDTYTASIVLLAMPYYGNITSNTQYVRYQSEADITIQLSDYWGRPVGSGWLVMMRTTVGVLDPDSAYTDKDGKVYSKLPWVNNSSPANITAYTRSTNGSSYPLEEYVEVVQATPVPSATINPTVTPTIVPNATAVVTPTAVPTAVPTTTATPTPGFELIAVLAASGLALAIRKR